jgi:hypothetical protein
MDRTATIANDKAVTRFLQLAFLAPNIVEAFYFGTQPIDLNVERLKYVKASLFMLIHVRISN